MIGMVKPLTYGRFGNFLFQAAAAMGYAWRHGLEFTLPNSTKDSKSNPIYLQHLVNPKWNPNLRTVTLTEKTHGYQELRFEEAWRSCNIVLDGYWQSEKYFKEFRERVLEVFGFHWELRQGWVSVHVRRTDYLKLTQKHPPVPKEWIEKAMAEFPGFSFRFFSDDISWCHQEFGRRKDCFFSPGTSEVDDLVQQSFCEHHICSASTFSWWAAWLGRNENKQVIMPKQWFQPGYRKTNTSDIVPLEWIRL